jgi:hypothetical protein
MKISTLALACLALIFFRCSDEKSEPEPILQTILSIKVDAQFPATEWDNWLVIHNSEGKLIDYKQFEAGEEFSFETKASIPDDKINVTLLRYRLQNGYNSHFLTTYMLVPIGQSWTVKDPEFDSYEPGTQIGNFKVEVSDVFYDYMALIGDKFGRTGSSTWSSNTYSGNAMIYDNASDFFLSVTDQSGNPRYKMFEDVSDGDFVKISSNEMKPFEKVVDVNFPSTVDIFFHVTGHEADQNSNGYWINSNVYSSSSTAKTNLKLGYTDIFDKYSTYLTFSYADRTFEYSKHGTAPTEINLPLTASFAGQNKSIRNFTFSKNQTFEMRRSYWIIRDLQVTPKEWINWEVISPDGAQLINEWPTELSTKYPDLALDKMVYSSSNFYTASPSYQAVIDAAFKGATLPDVASYGVIVK